MIEAQYNTIGVLLVFFRTRPGWARRVPFSMPCFQFPFCYYHFPDVSALLDFSPKSASLCFPLILCLHTQQCKQIHPLTLVLVCRKPPEPVWLSWGTVLCAAPCWWVDFPLSVLFYKRSSSLLPCSLKEESPVKPGGQLVNPSGCSGLRWDLH